VTTRHFTIHQSALAITAIATAVVMFADFPIVSCVLTFIAGGFIGMALVFVYIDHTERQARKGRMRALCIALDATPLERAALFRSAGYVGTEARG